MSVSKNFIESKIGETYVNYCGSKYKIIEYNNARDVVVEFENGFKKRGEYSHIRKGTIKSPYDKSIYNVACIGEGKYEKEYSKNKSYMFWVGMLRRCYDKKYIDKKPTYKGCSVCEEWLNYNNFMKWYDKNYYEIKGEQMTLDKDILIKGNKTYCPDTCVFVPSEINSLFTKRQLSRGTCPIGVTIDKNTKGENKYVASCNYKGKNIYLGRHRTVNEAFIEYKKFKENGIRQVAEEYKEKIPKELYKALIKYNVEITD